MWENLVWNVGAGGRNCFFGWEWMWNFNTNYTFLWECDKAFGLIDLPSPVDHFFAPRFPLVSVCGGVGRKTLPSDIPQRRKCATSQRIYQSPMSYISYAWGSGLGRMGAFMDLVVRFSTKIYPSTLWSASWRWSGKCDHTTKPDTNISKLPHILCCWVCFRYQSMVCRHKNYDRPEPLNNGKRGAVRHKNVQVTRCKWKVNLRDSGTPNRNCCVEVSRERGTPMRQLVIFVALLDAKCSRCRHCMKKYLPLATFFVKKVGLSENAPFALTPRQREVSFTRMQFNKKYLDSKSRIIVHVESSLSRVFLRNRQVAFFDPLLLEFLPKKCSKIVKSSF